MLIVVFKTIGFSLLVLLVAILFVFTVPLTVRLHFSDGLFTARLHIVFIRFSLFPLKAKKSRPKRKIEKKERKDKTEKEGTKKAAANIEFIRRILPPAGKLLRRLLKNIYIHGTCLKLIIRGTDASSTGIAAGRTWSAVCALAPLLNNVLHISYKSIRVIPDFGYNSNDKTEFDCKVTVIPVILIAALLSFLFKYLAIKNSDN